MFDGVIPERVRCLIHEKGVESGAGYEREGSAVIFDIEHKGLHLSGGDIGVTFFQNGGSVLGNQVQYELKGCGCALSFDQIKADRPDRLPCRKFIGPDFPVFPFLRGVELSVLADVYRESIVGADGSLLK